MKITSAQFITSSTHYANAPEGDLPEYAFIGRSNVGKSSLINRLTLTKELAKTSSKPGKTLLINHFLINNQWYLVDLPGYGYAQTDQATRRQLKKMITEYILHRRQLANLFLLLDARHEPLPNDLEFIQFLGENQVPFSLVFTKIDKISHAQLQNNDRLYQEILHETWETVPPFFYTSAKQGDGREALLDYIEQINQSW
jgi:GTP-binding protein